MSKLYNVHVGIRYTTDVLVEADSEDEAKEIVEQNIDVDAIRDSLEYANDDYDVWEEKNIEKFTKYYVMNKEGKMEPRYNY